jgi:ubiquitin-conjugating enzyme E2 Q
MADDDDDDESDYSYAYEDEDEDEGHFSGFLIPTDPFETTTGTGFPPAVVAGGDDDRVNVVVAEDFAAATVGPSPETIPPRSVSRAASAMSSGDCCSPSSHIPPRDEERKQKWREPTRAAVNMSLRAEKEKTGGRRRLASDLYKIMMADTKEAGFSLQPRDEDSMDKWCIKLLGFDEDSNLAKDLVVCGMDHVELEMSFPDQYPFEPPFVRVVKPRFKRQTGFVMSGALCMELLTKEGWNPINDIESVIVSIRSLMVVGDGRLQAAVDMPEGDYAKVLKSQLEKSKLQKEEGKDVNIDVDEEEVGDVKAGEAKRKRVDADSADSKSKGSSAVRKPTGGSYTTAEAQSAYDHLSKYHKQEGWDKSGWWSRKG